MKSSKCFFSKTIFRSDILRFLPFAAPLLIAQIIIFAVVPLARNSVMDISRSWALEDFAAMSIASDVTVILFAGVFALLTFSYLYSANSCIAMHAFPIGRKALFVTHFLSAFTLLVVPQVLGLAIGLPALFSFAAPVKCLLLQLLSIVGVSFVALAFAVFCVMLAGNLFAGAVIYLIVNFSYAALAAAVDFVVTHFGSGVNNLHLDLEKGFWLSPLVKLVLQKVRLTETAAGVSENSLLGRYALVLAIIAVIAAVFTGLAWLLYKKRALECAGDMVAFKAELPLLTVIVTLIGGIYAAMLFGSILDFEATGYIICFAVFAFLFWFGTQMILRKSPRVFQIRQFAGCLVTAALTVGLLIGVTVYETNYVPKTDNLSVNVRTSYAFTVEEPEEVNRVKELHRMLIDRCLHDTRNTEYLEDNNFLNVTLTYTLGSGNTFAREYSLPYSNEVAEIAKLTDELEKAHPPKGVADRLQGIDFTVVSADAYYYDTDGGSRLFTDEEAARLFELAAADNAAYLANYTTAEKGNANREVHNEVVFRCRLTNPEDIDKLRAVTDGDGVGGYIYLYDYYDVDIEGGTFEVQFDRITDGDQAYEYLKELKN